MKVRRLEEESLFEVESEKRPGQYYVVDLEVKSCTCGDHKFRGRICKHLCAVLNSVPEKEPEKYEKFKVLTVETIPTILADISKNIKENAEKTKRETLIYTDDPPGLKDWFEVC